MYSRREFIKISAFSAGLIMLNPFGHSGVDARVINGHRRKKMLYGHPKRGCSTPQPGPDLVTNIGNGARAFEEYSFLTPLSNGGYC